VVILSIYFSPFRGENAAVWRQERVLIKGRFFFLLWQGLKRNFYCTPHPDPLPQGEREKERAFPQGERVI